MNVHGSFLNMLTSDSRFPIHHKYNTYPIYLLSESDGMFPTTDLTYNVVIIANFAGTNDHCYNFCGCALNHKFVFVSC